MPVNKKSRGSKGTRETKSKDMKPSRTTLESSPGTQSGTDSSSIKSDEEFLLIDQPIYPSESLGGASTEPKNIPANIDSSASSSFTGTRKKSQVSEYVCAGDSYETSTYSMEKIGDTETISSATNFTKCRELKKKPQTTQTAEAHDISSIVKPISDSNLSAKDSAAEDTENKPKREADTDLYFKDDHFSVDSELYFKDDHFA